MHSVQGFTLIEVLVALVLLTLFSVSSYRALDAVLAAERHALNEMTSWRGLNRTFSRLEADLADALPDVRATPARRRGFITSQNFQPASSPLSSTPNSIAQSAGFAFDQMLSDDQSSGVQRIGYLFRDNTLYRLVWQGEAAEAAPSSEVALLNNISHIGFRYLDFRGDWLTDWPASAAAQLPRAIEMQISLLPAEGQAPRSLRRVFRTQ